MTNGQDECILHATAGTYIKLLAPSCVPLLLAIAILMRGAADAFEWIFFSSLLPVFWLAWLLSFRLRITPHSITYRSPFFRVQKLEREHVESIEYASASNTRILKRIRTVTIRPKGRGSAIVINVRVFSETNLRQQLEKNNWLLQR
jgi:hypothetical protein